MDRNMKKLLCVMAALLLLTGCRRGGGETTAPAESLPPVTTAPAVTLPQGEGVEEWDDPIETEPIETTEPQPGTTQAPENTTEPSEDPSQPTQDIGSTEPPVKNPDPTEEEIRVALSGNVCRCSAYVQILAAVRDAAKKLREVAAK